MHENTLEGTTWNEKSSTPPMGGRPRCGGLRHLPCNEMWFLNMLSKGAPDERLCCKNSQRNTMGDEDPCLLD